MRRNTQKIAVIRPRPTAMPMSGDRTIKTSVLVQPAGMIAPKPGLGNRRAGVAAEQRVRRARRQSVVPGNQVPDDGAEKARIDHREADDGQIDHAGADGSRDSGSGEERRREIEERGPNHCLAWREHARRDDGRNRIGRVVETVDVVEDEGDDDQPTDGEEVGVHPRSGVLDDYALEHVRDVLAPVRRVLEKVQDLLPLDDGDRVALLFEEAADGGLMRAVGFVLEAVDLDRRLGHADLLLERLQRLDHLVDGGADDAGQQPGVGADLLDLIEPHDGGASRRSHP